MADAEPLAPGLIAGLAAAAPGERAGWAKDWCVAVGIPELERRRAAAPEQPLAAQEPLIRDTEAVLDAVAALPGDQGGLAYVRPLLAQAAAAHLGHVPRPAGEVPSLDCLGRYVRSAPPGEALGFVVDWAVQAWSDTARELAEAAVQLAALTISHAMVSSADREVYGEAAQAARDLFTGLAGTVPRGSRTPVAQLIESAPERLAPWGFPPEAAGRIATLARICRDFGRSLPHGGRYPGAGLLG